MAEMTPRGLARKIKSLQATRPITASCGRALEIRGIWGFGTGRRRSTGWGGSQSMMDQVPVSTMSHW
jgi:hypothetical protein